MSHDAFVGEIDTFETVLPCFTGYAMGSLIANSEVKRLYLEQKHADLTSDLVKIERLKGALTKPIQSDSDETVQYHQDVVQRQILVYCSQIYRLEDRIKKIETVINKLKPEEEDERFSRTTFPIDHDASPVKTRKLSEESENMHYIVLKKQGAEDELRRFLEHLTQMHYLPKVIDLIDEVSKRILNIVNEEQEIYVLGSFITLNRVRYIDPIAIRKGAYFPKRLIELSNKYSIISQAILGGVFIGFATKIFKNQEPNNEEFEENNKQSIDRIAAIASQLSAFSYVTQGAIPVSKGLNLWDTYNDWKNRLLNNKDSGFPIAFKVSNLKSVLGKDNFPTISNDSQLNRSNL